MFCCMSSVSRIKAKWRYLKITSEIRGELESIPAFQKPFNPITTAEEKMGPFE